MSISAIETSEGGRFERDSCVSKSEKNRLKSAAISSKLIDGD